MSNNNQQGFTLIEVILVMAISSSLVMVAFVGQSQLRAQAQFDAAVNKVVSTIADAHNQATSGVNLTGSGNGITDCGSASSSSNNYVFGGAAWVAEPDGTFHTDLYKVVPGTDSCVFSTTNITMPATIKINATATPATGQGSKELFIRSNDVLNICPVQDNTVDVGQYFRAGNCPEAKIILEVSDDSGRKSQVSIDKSGLAQREN